MAQVTVTRRLHFNAAHRLADPKLSDAENLQVFGKCSNPNWHGHNYVLDVSVTGEVDPNTGFTYDLGALKRLVTEQILDQVDHKNFNLDVPFMRGKNPTTENIVVTFWQRLAPLVSPARLTRLVLWETPNNYVEYEGK